VPTFCADLSDYFVTAASDSMSVRDIQRGDNVFVKRLDPRKFWSGLMVLVDLGEWGATIGELHDDGARRYLRSNQGLPYSQEMNVEIINSDILGLVFLVTR
jgi:SOS-response transcriptional repressor LexA